MSSTDNQAGMVSGHAKYVKGAAEEMIGNATSSEEWKSSGATDKQAGLEEMREANQNRDESSGYGKVEEIVGKGVGCEGMEREGQKSQSE